MSPESLHSPHALLLLPMRTHNTISLLPNHIPASIHRVNPPLQDEGRNLIRGPILPETDSTDRQCYQWPVWLSLQHATLCPTFYGTLSCTAVNRSVGRKKKIGNKSGESVKGVGQRGSPGPHPHYWTSTECPVPNPSQAA